jgi:hypothetical protein
MASFVQILRPSTFMSMMFLHLSGGPSVNHNELCVKLYKQRQIFEAITGFLKFTVGAEIRNQK